MYNNITKNNNFCAKALQKNVPINYQYLNEDCKRKIKNTYFVIFQTCLYLNSEMFYTSYTVFY